MVHVEVFTGGESGEATIGSRSTDPHSFKGVASHASYRSYAENCTASHGHVLHFRSIDTWLDGVCVSLRGSHSQRTSALCLITRRTAAQRLCGGEQRAAASAVAKLRQPRPHCLLRFVCPRVYTWPI